MSLPEVLIKITVFGGFTVKTVKTPKNYSKVVFFKILTSFILVCPSITAMTGDKGVGS